MTFSISLKPVTITPSLYDIHKSFDNIVVGNQRGIKGEHHTRLVIFTAFVLGKNCMIIEGSRGGGKSSILSIVSSYCLNPMIVDQASDKAHIRNEALNKATHIIIPEINKITNSFLEALKDMGEGKAATYTILDEFKRTRTFKIEPKPFITSRADENDFNIGEELSSRLITVKTNSTKNMNQMVVDYKFLKAQNPFEKSEVTVFEINKLQDYVKMLPDIRSIVFIYTPGMTMSDAIPSLFTDSRRDTDKYLNNTYGITLFHYHDRIKTQIDGKTVLFVTPSDVWLNHVIIGKAIVRSALKCSEVEETIIQILRVYKQNNKHNPRMEVSMIHKTLHENGFNPNIKTVTKYCKQLYNNGYIVENDDKKPITYEPLSDDKSYDFKIDWKSIINECSSFMKKNYPEFAEEYIKRFTINPKVIHPFTGEEIYIETWEDENSKIKVKKEKTLLTTLNDSESKEEKILNDIDNGIKDAYKLETKYGKDVLDRMKRDGDIYEDPTGIYNIL